MDKVQQFWKDFCVANHMEGTEYKDAFQFGASADWLADLVVEGKKAATTSGYELYELEKEAIPQAGSFASILYPETKVIWKEPLSNDEEVKVLEALSINGESMDFIIYDKLVNGNSRKDIPRFSNYKIGYQITESFIENNPDSSIIEWTKLDANKIIGGSKYKERIFQ